jgi:hypothetical protein
MDTLPNGTILVANPAAGLWDDDDRWRLVEELRIGAVDGDSPALFGQIEQVITGPHDEILVLEGQAQEVRVFDANGGHVRTIGRKGGGPGEFAGAFGLFWGSGHRLWVAEAGNARYSVFDSAGSYLASHRRSVPGVVYPWQGGFGRDGRLYDVLFREGPDGSMQFAYFAMDDSAAVVDSLPALTYRRSALAGVPGPASLMAPRLTFRWDPAGHIWFGMTDSYRLHQRNFRGDTLRIVERPVERVIVSEAEKDSLIAEAARYDPRSIDRSLLPDTKPVFQRLLVDDVGYLWVQRMTAGGETGSVFDIIDPEGRFLGEVRSPAHLEWITAAEVRGDHVTGVTIDNLGVPYVVRLRIERGIDLPEPA